jgi:hypothetical protein
MATKAEGLGVMRIADFPFEERKRTRSDANVVELVVDHSVPDVAEYVLAVQAVRNGRSFGRSGEAWRLVLTITRDKSSGAVA